MLTKSNMSKFSLEEYKLCENIRSIDDIKFTKVLLSLLNMEIEDPTKGL